MDVFEIVTQRIMSEMEKGIIPWKRPWKLVETPAFNKISGHRYSLLNRMLLMHSGPYATYAQWQKLGGNVRAGEKSEVVVFWKFEQNRKDESEEEEILKKKVHPILKYYRVFHISQVDGLSEEINEQPDVKDTRPIVKAETMLQAYVNREQILLDEGLYDQAFYMPSEDRIHIPCIGQYDNAEEFYSTAFHEAVHSTGIAKRLNRPGMSQANFGSEVYSKEELIAEIGSSVILGMLGINSEATVKNSAAYIQNWLSALKNERTLIVFAAGQAEKAVHYITAELNNE